MKLAIAIQTPDVELTIPVALLHGSFNEKLQKAAKLGADGVELMTADPNSLNVTEIRSAIEETGIEVAAIGSGAVGFVTGLTLLHSDPGKANLAEVKLRKLIDFAADLGAPLVTIGGFRGRLASVGDGGRQQLSEILFKGASYANSCGIRLALEPLNRYETDVIFNTDEGLTLISEINHPALGLLLDTYHINIEESSWTEPFRRAMAIGKLWHVHIGDNNRLPPGEGLIDFHAIVSTLRDIGYTDYLSAELIPLPDPDTAAKQTLEFMNMILEK